MPFIATSARRQLIMAALLAAAAAGAVIRHQAPDPSTLRDVGTLLLVLWLPAVGNVIAFLLRKLPARTPAPTQFPPGAPFAPQLHTRLELLPFPADFIASLDPRDDRATLIAGRQGFTVRMDQPVVQWLDTASPQPLALQCLVPEVALRVLVPGTEVHLLVGRQGVARGWIEAPATL
jgi:hypothetical protein